MNISTLLRRTFILFGLALGQNAWATKVYFVPGFCEPQDLSFQIQNKSAFEKTFWLQQRFDGQVFETPYDVPAGEQIHIQGAALIAHPESLTLKTHDEKDLQFQAECLGFAKPYLTDVASPRVTHFLGPGTQAVKLALMNLATESQTVSVRFLNTKNEVLKTEQVLLEKYYDTVSTKWTAPAGTVKVEVLGANRLHSWAFAQTEFTEVFSPGVPLMPFTMNTPLEPATYFLVSTKEASASESFVIRLTDPEMIKKAKDQLGNPSFDKIVVGRIQAGHGGFNRSFHRKDRAPYSWSVNHVDALADFAYIDCDGSPNLVEERLHQRLEEGGRICFWRYRIVKELTVDQIKNGKL